MTLADAVGGTPAPAVVRAAAVLRAIAAADGDAPSVTDLAETLDAPRSSTTNIVAALVDAALVRRVGNGFVLGPGLVDLASAFLKQDDAVGRFRAFVPALTAVSQETVQLATLDGSDVVYVACHVGSQPITLTSSIGKRLPATNTALGKAMLSRFDGPELQDRVGSPLPQLTPRSHANAASLLADLETTRVRGFAIDDEEAAANVMCLAVAVERGTNQGAYAVSTTFFKDRLTPELQTSLVRDLTSLARYLESA